MLIVARKRGQQIIINNEIKIRYLGLNKLGQAKFGIDAPRNVSIHREEVQDRINKERSLGLNPA